MSDEQRIAPVRSAMGFSVALHLGVIALVTFGVPWLAAPPPEPSPPVIEVVTAEVADKTNPPPPKAIERPEPPKPEPAKPTPQPVTQPEPPKPKPEPPKQAEAAPAPEPLPLPKPKEIAKPVEKPPEPTPVPKAKPAPPKPAFDPNTLSALLDKRIKKDAVQAPPTPAPATPQRSTATSSQLANLNERLTMSELDAIRQQIERNWSIPAGAKDAANLIVRIHIALNPDGTLRGTPQILDQSRMGEDYFRIAAESAVRAIYKSEPLKLPADKYEAWRDVTLTFNPREMLGG